MGLLRVLILLQRNAPKSETKGKEKQHNEEIKEHGEKFCRPVNWRRRGSRVTISCWYSKSLTQWSWIFVLLVSIKGDLVVIIVAEKFTISYFKPLTFILKRLTSKICTLPEQRQE